jgi:hypothetical protein
MYGGTKGHYNVFVVMKSRRSITGDRPESIYEWRIAEDVRFQAEWNIATRMGFGMAVQSAYASFNIEYRMGTLGTERLARAHTPRLQVQCRCSPSTERIESRVVIEKK